MRLACIDVGSNTTRLLVAEAIPGGLLPVRNERVFTLIGRSLDADGRIPADKVEQTAETVAAQVQTALELGAEAVRAVATAAIRGAANGDELAAAVARRASIPLEVLPGEDEARLAYRGAAQAVGGSGSLAVVDVGGGSTEVAVGDAAGSVVYAQSVAVGSASLAARHLGDDPPAPRQVDAARAEAAAALEGVQPPAVDRAVAVGGSASSLQVLAGPELGPEPLAAALQVLLSESSRGVASRFGLDRERVRLLPAGLVVLEQLSRRLGRPLRICKGGLREGVILEMIGETH